MGTLKNIPEEIHRYLLEEEKDDLPNACLICGNHPLFWGYIEKFNPNRMLIYCLCSKCYEEPDIDITVEKIICYYEIKGRNNPDLLEHHGECWSPFPFFPPTQISRPFKLLIWLFFVCERFFTESLHIPNRIDAIMDLCQLAKNIWIPIYRVDESNPKRGSLRWTINARPAIRSDAYFYWECCLF